MIANWFLCLCWLGVVHSQRTNFETSSCQETVLTASSGWKVFTSPNYPKKFAKQTQCNWVIRALDGYRIELKFDSFYLLGSPTTNAGCHIQHINIRDLLSGITDGRYCGNTLPPSIISTGRRLRITLESNAVRLLTTQYYHGFRAEYRISRQPSSLRLRDGGGRWRSYGVLGGDVIVTTTTPAQTVPTRDPEEIDDNNNAAIDKLNNQANNKNVNNNEVVNKQNNEFNHPPEYETLPPRRATAPPPRIKKRPNLIISSKPLPPRGAIPNRIRPPMVPANRPGNSVLISSGDNENKKAKSPSSLLIGGAIGGVLALILIIVVVWQLVRRRLNKENKSRKPIKKWHSSRVGRTHQDASSKHEAHRLKHLPSHSKLRENSFASKPAELPRKSQHLKGNESSHKYSRYCTCFQNHVCSHCRKNTSRRYCA